MSGVRLNEEIMKTIRDSADTEQVVKKFVIDLILEEIKDPSRWKEIYKKKIETFSDTTEGK